MRSVRVPDMERQGAKGPNPPPEIFRLAHLAIGPLGVPSGARVVRACSRHATQSREGSSGPGRRTTPAPDGTRRYGGNGGHGARNMGAAREHFVCPSPALLARSATFLFVASVSFVSSVFAGRRPWTEMRSDPFTAHRSYRCCPDGTRRYGGNGGHGAKKHGSCARALRVPEPGAARARRKPSSPLPPASGRRLAMRCRALCRRTRRGRARYQSLAGSRGRPLARRRAPSRWRLRE